VAYSPALAAVTAAFEVGAAIWVLRGSGRRAVLRTAAGILVFLAGYQIVEVAICSAAPGYGFLPRLAFTVVTWLPPLGILLAALLLGERARPARLFAYGMFALAGAIIVWIAVDRSFATLSVCNAVYAKYENPMPRFLAYSSYYWLGLLGLVSLAAYGAFRSTDAHDRRLSRQLLAGSLAFLVPAVITSEFVPATQGALPSVMCHFAIVLAIFLVRLVYLERLVYPAGKNVAAQEDEHPSAAG